MTGFPAADPTAVAARFNEYINTRDIDGLAGLMTEDHTFVDAGGGVLSGKRECLDAWRGFFESFPDYRNVFASMTAQDDVVAIAGHSECSEPALARAGAVHRRSTRWRGGRVAGLRGYARGTTAAGNPRPPVLTITLTRSGYAPAPTNIATAGSAATVPGSASRTSRWAGRSAE
ncbi:MAG TPA: nuclear transport factor 2 family protein [Jiangellales bacterium]|nr:nuclear transport factor 2 family protein [Jiangellales bacterium]